MLKAKKFYFTFGTDEKYPFQGGWVEIIAENKKEAIITFQAHYPNRQGSPFYNACDCYESSYFEETNMFTNGNLGAYCHRVIHNSKFLGETAIVLTKKDFAKIKEVAGEKQYQLGKKINNLLKKAHLTYEDDVEDDYCVLRWYSVYWTEFDEAVKFIMDYLKTISDYDYLAIRYASNETEKHYGTGNDWLTIRRSIGVER